MPDPAHVVAYPRISAGLTRPDAAATKDLVTAAWLLAVEARAFIEDLEGGAQQPLLQRMVKLRLLELLWRIDVLLSGATAPADEHALAMALELGWVELASLDGAALVERFALREALCADATDVDGTLALWRVLVTDFIGELPDPLQSTQQGAILRALRSWTKLCERIGVDAAFLQPLLKDV